MVHRRLMGPGFAVVAALLAFSGATFAQSPVVGGTPNVPPAAPAVPATPADPADPCAGQEATGPDTDTLQSGDQTGVDPAAGAGTGTAEVSDPAEVAGPDTDNIQAGDQTGVDPATGADTDTTQAGGQTGADAACATDPSADGSDPSDPSDTSGQDTGAGIDQQD